MSAAAKNRPIVLCPLQHERRTLLRLGIGTTCELACCGPGAAGVQRWCAAIGCLERPVILAGVAGGLAESVHAGMAAVVDEVIDPESLRRCKPNLRWNVDPHASVRWRATSTAQIVNSPAERASLHVRTGAEIVDMESVAFARLANANQWRWGIVRGVSDDWNSGLPAEFGQWINPTGTTRPWAVLKSLVLQPSLMAEAMRIHRHSSEALSRVAMLIRQVEFEPD